MNRFSSLSLPRYLCMRSIFKNKSEKDLKESVKQEEHQLHVRDPRPVRKPGRLIPNVVL